MIPVIIDLQYFRLCMHKSTHPNIIARLIVRKFTNFFIFLNSNRNFYYYILKQTYTMKIESKMTHSVEGAQTNSTSCVFSTNERVLRGEENDW